MILVNHDRRTRFFPHPPASSDQPGARELRCLKCVCGRERLQGTRNDRPRPYPGRSMPGQCHCPSSGNNKASVLHVLDLGPLFQTPSCRGGVCVWEGATSVSARSTIFRWESTAMRSTDGRYHPYDHRGSRHRTTGVVSLSSRRLLPTVLTPWSS